MRRKLLIEDLISRAPCSLRSIFNIIKCGRGCIQSWHECLVSMGLRNARRPMGKNATMGNLKFRDDWGEGVTYRMIIPNWHPTRLNKLLTCHPKTAGRLNKADRNLVCGYALRDRFPVATTRRRVDLHITLGPRQKEGDEGNWWKSLEDALVKAKPLIDDNRHWYERGDVTFERVEKHERL